MEHPVEGQVRLSERNSAPDGTVENMEIKIMVRPFV